MRGRCYNMKKGGKNLEPYPSTPLKPPPPTTTTAEIVVLNPAETTTTATAEIVILNPAETTTTTAEIVLKTCLTSVSGAELEVWLVTTAIEGQFSVSAPIAENLSILMHKSSVGHPDDGIETSTTQNATGFTLEDSRGAKPTTPRRPPYTLRRGVKLKIFNCFALRRLGADIRAPGRRAGINLTLAEKLDLFLKFLSLSLFRLPSNNHQISTLKPTLDLPEPPSSTTRRRICRRKTAMSVFSRSKGCIYGLGPFDYSSPPTFSHSYTPPQDDMPDVGAGALVVRVDSPEHVDGSDDLLDDDHILGDDEPVEGGGDHDDVDAMFDD
ncbi:hypothetical protein BUALT_Bualt04G0044900 [Buddleja alternifolia]|uniref:Uncharacterized protein n=1 Tax=Buddleja alternifolia TaxID=168488 RepID=A0AAV6XL96_9LAMI|nr:hypothetical protein BUALT_Bualt04G0044900 [Buddleja alternifolia]